MNEGWGRRAGFPGTGAGTFILRSSAGKQKQQVKARNHNLRTSLAVAVQWLRLCTSNAEDAGWIPAQGTKIPRAAKEKGRKEEKNERMKERKKERMKERKKEKKERKKGRKKERNHNMKGTKFTAE